MRVRGNKVLSHYSICVCYLDECNYMSQVCVCKQIQEYSFDGPHLLLIVLTLIHTRISSSHSDSLMDFDGKKQCFLFMVLSCILTYAFYFPVVTQICKSRSVCLSLSQVFLSPCGCPLLQGQQEQRNYGTALKNYKRTLFQRHFF